MSAGGVFPSLGVRVDAIGTEQATAKIRKFGTSVGSLPRDFQAASRSSAKFTVNMQKMSFAAFGASLAITSTVTSLSRLEKSALNVNRATVALERGQDLVTRKQAALNKIMQQGETFTGQLALANSELQTALNDVVVKIEDLNIKTGEVTDTYINFAASLGASVLFSVTAFFSAVRGLEFAQVKAKVAAIGHAVSLRLVRGSAITASPAMAGMTTVTAGTTIAMIKATFAAHGLAAGLKAMTLSFAPLIIALAVLTALWAIHESNILGTKTALDAMLGITQEQTTATDEATVSQEGLNEAMGGPQGGLKRLQDLLPTKEKLTFQTLALATAIGAAATQQERLNDATRTATALGGAGREVSVILPGGQTGTVFLPETGVGAGQERRLPPLASVFGPLSATDMLNRRRQIQEFKDQTKQVLTEILDLTKRMSEEDQRRIANQFIIENFHEDERASAQQLLSLLISQNREREKAVELEEAKFKAVTPLFDFLFKRGLIGQAGGSVIGRGRGGIAQVGGGAFGGAGQFLGFQSGVGSTITVGGQTFQSRIVNPNFGKTFGGGGPALGAQSVPGLGSAQFAQGGFASGGASNVSAGVGTPIHIIQRIAAERARRRSDQGLVQQGVFQGFGGGGAFGRTQSKIFKSKPGLQAAVEAIREAVGFGLITQADVTQAFSNGVPFGDIAAGASRLLNQLLSATRAQAKILDLDILFGSRVRFGVLGRRLARRRGKTVTPEIDTPNELRKAIARVQAEAERQAFTAELEQRIAREGRFQIHQLANPDVRQPEGTALFLDTQPLADALEKILQGEDHRQFIKLLAAFKVR